MPPVEMVRFQEQEYSALQQQHAELQRINSTMVQQTDEVPQSQSLCSICDLFSLNSQLYSYGLYSHGLHSYGLYSHGLCSCVLYSYGLRSAMK